MSFIQLEGHFNTVYLLRPLRDASIEMCTVLSSFVR